MRDRPENECTRLIPTACIIVACIVFYPEMKTLSQTPGRLVAFTSLFLFTVAFQSCDLKMPFFPFLHAAVTHPDSSINNLIMLRKPATVPAFISSAINDTGKFVVLTNVNELEYVIAYTAPKHKKQIL